MKLINQYIVSDKLGTCLRMRLEIDASGSRLGSRSAVRSGKQHSLSLEPRVE